ncbi:hypothetical protein ABPG77_001785 [Micractinium sp. CCAP 211/92]
MTAACQSIAAGITRCLDQEDVLQELFLGSPLASPVSGTVAEAAEAPEEADLEESALELVTDVGRIQIERAGTDGLREALMSS